MYTIRQRTFTTKRILTAVGTTMALACFLSGGSAFARKTQKRLPNFEASRPAAIPVSIGPTGVVAKILNAGIAADGTVTARFTLVDSVGTPLDRLGIYTPGAVSSSLIVATIPAGQTQYVSYTTTVLKATINSNPSQIQAANDSGGTFTQNTIGDYTYTFKTKAPAGFDQTATHSVGISSFRDLSAYGNFQENLQTSNDVFTFVPDGSKVLTIRNVVATQSCNGCHNPMFAHGGSRVKVELCIMCHTPQTVNPDTGLSMDMKVLIHKIHDGASLPSVIAGTPYRVWHRGAWSDFSGVVFPQEIRNCTTCHAPGPAQADNWKTNPSAAACGSCHDNVNFATGVNHVNLPVFSDTQCSQCHTAKATGDFDASIPGAHVIANYSTSLPGLVTKIIAVDNAVPGSAPIVTFSVNDKAGNPVDISKVTSLRVVLGGPNNDYQTGAGGIRVSEDPSTTPGSGGVYAYTMTNKIPAAATGSYTVSIEARNTVTLAKGTTKEVAATDAANPVEFYFSVDSSAMVARRQVVSTDKCAACHTDLKIVHGGTRNSVQECTICHNPTLVDGTSKQSVSLATQIHSIHRGENLANPYILGTTNYQEVLFPGDLRVCSTCHVNETQRMETVGGVAMVQSPGGFLPQLAPTSAACQGCHDSKAVASHVLSNTTLLGESCLTCHGVDGAFSVDLVHKQQ